MADVKTAMDALQAAVDAETAKSKSVTDQIDALSVQIRDLVQQRSALQKQLSDSEPDDLKKAKLLLESARNPAVLRRMGML